jgi:hypothetical protein
LHDAPKDSRPESFGGAASNEESALRPPPSPQPGQCPASSPPEPLLELLPELLPDPEPDPELPDPEPPELELEDASGDELGSEPLLLQPATTTDVTKAIESQARVFMENRVQQRACSRQM